MSLLSRFSLFFFVIAFASATQSVASDCVVIVLDDSGSMNEKMSGGIRRIDAAKNAISILLKQFPPDTKLGLLLLNGDRAKQHWAIPLEHLSVPQALRRVDSVVADGGTPLGDRMREGADALLRLREQRVYGNYRLLIVTDGEANDAKLLAQYLPDVLSRGIVVDAIGVDMKKNHSLATRVHSYRRADDAAALSNAVQEVFAEKSDSGNSDANDDFTLLQAIDDETAKQALQALSKPTNSPIVGLSIPSDTANVILTPNGSASGVTPTSGGSFFLALIATILSCMLPVAIVVIILFVFLSKSKQTGRQRH